MSAQNPTLRLILGVVLVYGITGLVWPKTWWKEYDVRALAMAQASDGGVILAYEDHRGTDSDLAALKLDANGDVSWSIAAGGVYGERASDVIETRGGGFVVVGRTGLEPSGQREGWIVGLSRRGEIAWQRSYGGGFFDDFSSVARAEGGFIVAGNTESFGVGSKDLWVVKLDDRGRFVWSRAYGTPDIEFGSQILAADDGGYVLVGRTQASNSSDADVLLVKLDGQGAVRWAKRFRRLGDARVAIDRDGGIVMASAAYTHGLQLMRLNASGTVVWAKEYRTSGILNFPRVRMTPVGEILVSTSREGDLWLGKFDGNGELIWQRATSDDSYVVSFGLDIVPNLRGRWLQSRGLSDFQSMNAPSTVVPERLVTDRAVNRFGSRPLFPDDPGYDILALGSSYRAWLMKLTSQGDILGSACGNWDPCDTVSDPVGPGTPPTAASLVTTPIPALYESSPVRPARPMSVQPRLVCKEGGRPRSPELGGLPVPDICLEGPELELPPARAGAPRPTACNNDEACPTCVVGLTFEASAIDNPIHRARVFQKLPVLFMEGVGDERFAASLAEVAAALGRAPTGPYFTEESKARIVKRLEAIHGSSQWDRDSAVDVLRALNEIELDLRVPSRRSSQAVTASASNYLDLGGMARVTVNGVARSGDLELEVTPDLPGGSSEFLSAWPIATYQLRFSGRLDGSGFLEIDVPLQGYSGMRAGREFRLYQWDGATYRDITTGMDSVRRVLIGRTTTWGPIVVLQPI